MNRATFAVLSILTPTFRIWLIGSSDTPKFIVTTLLLFIAVLSVSFVAHPVLNDPLGRSFVIAPINSNSVVVDGGANGVDVMLFDAGTDMICQNSIAPVSSGRETPGRRKKTNSLTAEISRPVQVIVSV